MSFAWPAPYRELAPNVFKIARRLGNPSGRCFKNGSGWPYMKHYYKHGGPCRRCGHKKGTP